MWELFGYAEALESCRLSHLNRYQPQFLNCRLKPSAWLRTSCCRAACCPAPLSRRTGIAARRRSREFRGCGSSCTDRKTRRGPLTGNTPGKSHWDSPCGITLQSGDLYLTESRNHGHFWNLVYDQARWEQERQQGFALLSLPVSADPALQHLELELNRVAAEARQGLPTNPFASRAARSASNLKQQDRLEVLESTEQLRATF